MIKARIRWCSCRVENILTLGKLFRLWFCFLLHSVLCFYISNLLSYIQNIFIYELARSPIMRTIFLDIIRMNKSQELTFFLLRQKLTSAMKLKARKVMVDFKFDALYS